MAQTDDIAHAVACIVFPALNGFRHSRSYTQKRRTTGKVVDDIDHTPYKQVPAIDALQRGQETNFATDPARFNSVDQALPSLYAELLPQFSLT